MRLFAAGDFFRSLNSDKSGGSRRNVSFEEMSRGFGLSETGNSLLGHPDKGQPIIEGMTAEETQAAIEQWLSDRGHDINDPSIYEKISVENGPTYPSPYDSALFTIAQGKEITFVKEEQIALRAFVDENRDLFKGSGRAHRAFEKLDLNGDGVLTQSELEILYSQAAGDDGKMSKKETKAFYRDLIR